jgi:hypothetical protein
LKDLNAHIRERYDDSKDTKCGSFHMCVCVN